MVSPMQHPLFSTLWLLLALLLGGCSDRAARRTQQLEDRVRRLEAWVEALQAQLGRLQRPSDAARVTDLAGARTCAFDLARVLEAYCGDNGRYPAAGELVFPGSCADLRVDWRQLGGAGYAFDVLSTKGAVLASQQGP